MSSDNTIVDEIQARYVRDHRIPHAGEIAVGERHGVVTLRGSVGSIPQIHAAVEIAKSVSGVREVENELVLDPRDHWEDDEMRGAALRVLMSDDYLAEHVEVHVDNAWVTLKGEVKHQYDSDAAFEAISTLPGVGGITNEIKVVTAGIS